MYKFTPLLFFVFLLSCIEQQPPLWDGFPMSTQIEELATLPKKIKESSGLVYWQQGLWTINDGGNGPYLFQVGIHKKKMKSEIKIKGIDNNDWESLAQDSSYFYLGDFGNNDGTRTDLSIHRVNKQTLVNGDDKVASNNSIAFTYQDQEVGILPRQKHNFDCEAMVVSSDSIFLFSKNHGDQQCTIYRMANVPGTQSAIPLGRFNTRGKITGAAWTPSQNRLLLLGYNNSSKGHRPFVWIFSKFSGRDFFSGVAKRYNLPMFLQTEGICHFADQQYLLTCEAENGGKGKVFMLQLEND